ncbi:general stress protein [Pseudalkalibacillus hwajinpoensis]|uniref:General stress protein n=1 Tax=Guptibacillus hwajinpoensis TaxID=208199 RepID=A0A4U1MIE8_9BACL|nr:general stress protein [Pseudalkalibacillus hwajinpoensis]TKD70511.1 general stress protein [Pseudalkalibacillus hwajinpoensis]
MSRPVVREYQNDEKLKSDIEELGNIGVSKDDIYVLSHDDDRTKRVAEGVDANTIGKEEMGLSSLKNVFSKKGDELREKMQEIGFSEDESERYEEEMDKGKIFLFVTDTDKVAEWK